MDYQHFLPFFVQIGLLNGKIIWSCEEKIVILQCILHIQLFTNNRRNEESVRNRFHFDSRFI